MPAPTTATELADLIRRSGLIDPTKLKAYAASRTDTPVPADALAVRLQADGLLTPFQVAQLLRGKFRRLVLGKYKVLDRIGLGGMGEVFLAEHLKMRRRAAIKVLPRNRYEDPFARERFLREARAAGQLDHPNIVRAFDVGEETGVIFLVMEYVEGISLQDLVARRGPLDPAAAAGYLIQIARGLAYLGDRGLVHRDIKPANLLVTPDGVVKILDLGLVRSEADIDDLTHREGSPLLGSADYLAPEQAVSS
jgi:serine/threonine protein kinase